MGQPDCFAYEVIEDRTVEFTVNRGDECEAAFGPNPTHKYRWDFGDGSPIVDTSQEKVRHQFPVREDPKFTVLFVVYPSVTSTTASFAQRKDISINDMESASFEWSADGRKATFMAVAVGGVPPYTYGWTFGDGTLELFVTDPEVSHMYSAAGTYTVTLRAEDSFGQSIIVSADVTVTMAEPDGTVDASGSARNQPLPAIFYVALVVAGIGFFVWAMFVRRLKFW